MKCKHFSIRSKKYQRYKYCRKQKKEINYEVCSKCKLKEYSSCYEIKNKSKKLAKLESKRTSILTENLKVCYICGQKAVNTHEIFGGCNRIVSIKNSFCVPLCFKCHRDAEENVEVGRYLQRECQKEFEKTHTREEFSKKIGRNFL